MTWKSSRTKSCPLLSISILSIKGLTDLLIIYKRLRKCLMTLEELVGTYVYEKKRVYEVVQIIVEAN